MKAVGYYEQLPVENERALLDLELPVPVPAGRDLLVRVKAVSVNPRDVKSRRAFPASTDAPMVLGYDASGIVEEVGAEVSLFKKGDEVFYAGVLNRPGSNAEFQLVDERITGHKPVSVDHAIAASIPLTALTAYEMLFDRLEVERKITAQHAILILGGAGGVPSIAIQLARQAGLTVIATASRPESEKWVRDLGAHYVINHTQPLDSQIKNLGIDSVDYIFSTHTNAKVWHEMAAIISAQGKLGMIDDPEPLDLRVFKAKSASIHWEAMFTRPMLNTPDMIRQHEILNKVAGLIDKGTIRTTMTQNLGLINATNLRQAHGLIEKGNTIGKIVLEGF